MGGWTQAIRRGYIKNEVEKSSHEYSKQIWDDKRVIVGVNKYQEGEEIPIPLGHEFVVDEEAIIERIKEFKRKRDNEKVKKMLGRIKEAAMTEDADITPVTVEAARAHVTMGEICGVLKEVFEWKVW
jgi:methylmalonyl-CoA mutase N-terminal domain/subunit